MATLTLGVSYISDDLAIIDWEVDQIGLNMTEGGICTQTPDGGYNEPGEILDSSAAYPSGALKAASGSYTAYRDEYPGSSFACNGFGVTANGNYSSAGGRKSVRLNWPAPPPTRPENWKWWSVVEKNKPIAFTVAEWNAFYARINAFLGYRGQGPWPNFVPVYKGAPITAKMVQEVTAAIQGMTSAQMPPIPVAGKTVITADYFNKLKEYLNSVT